MMRRILVSALTALALLLTATAPASSQDASPGGGQVLDTPQRYAHEVFADVTTTTGIPFATVTDYHGTEQVLLLDLTLPVGDVATGRPAVVWMGGGGFTGVTRSSMANWTQRSARRGYVAITIDYRVRPDLDINDWVNHIAAIKDAGADAQAAVRWLRANAATYGVDPDRIVTGGYSAGAVTSLWTAFNEEWADPAGANQPQPSDISAGVAFAGAFGGTPVPGDPPIAMFHGDKDTRVAYDAGVAQCDAQLNVGNICEFTTLSSTHALPWDQIYDPAFDFIYRMVSCGEAFDDLPLPHQFCGDIDWLVTNGLANGYADGGFHPTATFSRQALVAMLWRMVGAPTGFADPGFADVPVGHPFHDAIAWGVDAGIVSGYLDGTFQPTTGVSRQAAVTWLWKLVGSPAGAPDPGFTDVSAGQKFYDGIAWAADAGVTGGYADGGFHPGSGVSRQAGSAQLHRTAPLLP